VRLAQEAGLETGDGVVVNEYLQTPIPYLRGGDVRVPTSCSRRPAVEHWDNAVVQGRWRAATWREQVRVHHMPYFYSDCSSRLRGRREVEARLGTFLIGRRSTRRSDLLPGGRPRARRDAVQCVGKVEAARELIRRGDTVSPESLRGAIR